MKKKSMLIVAAEASSVLYAKRLLEHYKAQGAEIDFFGIGNLAMEQMGFRRLGRSEEMAVMGFQEILKKGILIFKTFRRIVEEVKRKKPEVALLLDYPDFNLRLAGKMKKLKVPVLYYISPKIWAWRRSRIFTIKKRVDKMLVVFPFEEKIYKDHGVPVQFVGHPLLDELKQEFFDLNLRKTQRSRYGLKEENPVLALMPGSRLSELDYHLKLQLEVAKKLIAKRPHLRIVLLLAPSLKKEDIQSRMASFSCPPFILVQDEAFKMIQLADLFLVASGTATLMVGMMEKPMVIMYKTSPLSAFLIRILVRKMPGLVRCFGLVNLILGKRLFPEFFQKQANVNSLSSALEFYLSSPKEMEKAREDLKALSLKMGSKGATQRVAENVSAYF